MPAGPPPGDFRDWTRDDWIAALDANMLTAIELIKGDRRPHGRAALRAHRQHHVGRRYWNALNTFRSRISM